MERAVSSLLETLRMCTLRAAGRSAYHPGWVHRRSSRCVPTGPQLRCSRCGACSAPPSKHPFITNSRRPHAQFNLGWKLALVQKGLAPPTLLTTYTAERLPVTAAMLQETTRLTARAGADQEHADAERLRAARAHRNHLKQFGVNCRWSAGVRDERAPWGEGEERDPYGVLSGGLVRAGDRAPDAPGLVGVVDGRVSTVFDVFSPARHTVLIFETGAGRAEAMVKAVGRYPQGLVASVVVLPSEGKTTEAVGGADMTLRDRDGLAYEAYGMTDGQAYTVIVRPDGVVGGIVAGEEGVAKYFGNIFYSV